MLEKAKAHFKQLVHGEGLRVIVVPEWGDRDEPAKIYFKPMSALTVKTYSQIIEWGSKQTVEAFIDILILRCCDEQGKPLFKSVNKTEMLREISPIIVCDIIRQMSEQEKGDLPVGDIEQAEKNS